MAQIVYGQQNSIADETASGNDARANQQSQPNWRKSDQEPLRPTRPTGNQLNDSTALHYHPSVDPQMAQTRQQLLSRLIRLSTALEHQHWDISETLLHQFCDALLDYLTLSHELAFTNSQPSTHLCAAIASTTRTALAFYDCFFRGTGSLTLVRQALEHLALALETRFELEDELHAHASAA